MVRLTGSETEYEQLKKFYNLSRVFAEKVWDTMLEPLVGKAKFRKQFDLDSAHREAWRSLVEAPLGDAIERYLENDLVRGLVFTDAKVGVLTHPHDESLLQNRCFLYHLIGNKTGEWKVPAGGMGAVARELERAARESGAEMFTRAPVTGLALANRRAEVIFYLNDKPHSVEAQFLLVNFGCNVLAKLLGKKHEPAANDEGSVFKMNMLLRRLPKLKASPYPEKEAFCGTFHIDEGYEEMNVSYEQAASGKLPDKIPSEIYCHTLTDDSILSPELREQGFHTITLFGLDVPWRLFSESNKMMRERAEQKFVSGLNHWLAEPLEECLAVARDGSLCLESKSPVDIEESLGMYHGNIFQNAPTFPFALTDDEAGKWGVETDYQNIFLCGSSAQRGGAVSGIPGHNAAKKVLEQVSTSTGRRSV